MSWTKYKDGFKTFLKLEKNLSDKTLEAYLLDVKKLEDFICDNYDHTTAETVSFKQIQALIIWLNELGISARSQARILSGIKNFYKYLVLEGIIEENPTALIEMPKLGLKLPEVLSIIEIDNIEKAIDLSKAEGHRNKAIIETLFSCGLRVSELTELKLSNVFFQERFIRVIGKGDKERLVPISEKALNDILLYLPDRNSLPVIHPESADILFLNRRGKKLTRVMIFTIVKELAKAAGINKKVSPHTFRHSFATCLVDGGADLRAVQEMLGHESIVTTEIYTHLDKEYLRDTIFQFHPRS